MRGVVAKGRKVLRSCEEKEGRTWLELEESTRVRGRKEGTVQYTCLRAISLFVWGASLSASYQLRSHIILIHWKCGMLNADSLLSKILSNRNKSYLKTRQLRKLRTSSQKARS